MSVRVFSSLSRSLNRPMHSASCMRTTTTLTPTVNKPAFLRYFAIKAGDKRFTKEHEYLFFTSPSAATIGITDYAQKELGDVVFVDLPESGSKFSATEAFASVESVKAASSVYAPVDIEVTAKNSTLANDCSLINKAAEGDGWMIKAKLTKPEQAEKLLTQKQYQEHVEAEKAKH